MSRLDSSARPYPDASTAAQREANRAAAALVECTRLRSLAAPAVAPAWLRVLRRARLRDGDTPCLRLRPPQRHIESAVNTPSARPETLHSPGGPTPLIELAYFMGERFSAPRPQGEVRAQASLYIAAAA